MVSNYNVNSSYTYKELKNAKTNEYYAKNPKSITKLSKYSLLEKYS